MKPWKRLGQAPPPDAKEMNLDGVLGPPVYHIPMPTSFTRVEPIAVDEWQVIEAGPAMTPEEAKAWRERKAGGTDDPAK